MSPITISLPDYLNLSPSLVKEYLAAKLYQDRKISLSEAATISGVNKWDFPAVLTKYGIPFFDLTSDELKHDIDAA